MEVLEMLDTIFIQQRISVLVVTQYNVARSATFGGKQFCCKLSCDLVVTNEGAPSWDKIAS